MAGKSVLQRGVRQLKGQGQKLALLLLAGDLAVAAASWMIVYWLRFAASIGPPPPGGAPPFEWCARGIPLILLLTVLSCRISELHKLHRLRQPRQELAGIFKANAILFLLLSAITFYRKDPYQSRLALGMFLLLNASSQATARQVAWLLIHSLRAKGFNPSPALIVGTGRMAQKLALTLLRNAWTGLEPIGFVDRGPERTVHGLAILGTIEQLAEIVNRRQVAYVFVALPLQEFREIRHVMAQLADLPVDIRLVPDVPMLAAMSLTTSVLDGLPIIGLRRSPHEGVNRIVKRAMDVLIASFALLILAPVLLVIALVVKLTSRGPVFYRQERASLGGEPFQMLKFRTMRVDAEQQTGPVWATEHDPRRTGIGRFLRRTSLDELPQLVNVLRGQMSLVGPRPERPVFINKFRSTVPHYMLRHAVKAGITGWAQIHGWRGNTSLRKRLQYDLYYISHWTPWLDIRIMLLTLLGAMGRNAY